MAKERLGYISYSSWRLFESSPEQWVLKYLTDAPREKQTKPMAIGSAFDARVKGRIRKRLGIGEDNTEELFATGVEDHVKDEAWRESGLLMGHYEEQGVLETLIREMEGRLAGPLMENDLTIDVQGTVEVGAEPVTVRIRVKLDLYYLDKDGIPVVLDWKVNGWYGQKPTSPAPGYVSRVTAKGLVKGEHRNAIVHLGRNRVGIEENQKDWAEQTTMYAWAMGVTVGTDEFRISVDQVCGNRESPEFARHRYDGTSRDFQLDLFQRLYWSWYYIQKGHYFRDLTEEESRKKTDRLLEEDGYLFYG